MAKNKLLSMNNVGIVVKSLDDAIAFFTELGLTLEGRAIVEGEWAGRVTGLGTQRVEIAMMVVLRQVWWFTNLFLKSSKLALPYI
jgi:hypothetical protein